MNKYSGIRESLRMPEILVNSSGLDGILQTTKKLIDQVEVENQFSRGVHTMYQHLSENILKSSSSAESSFNEAGSTNSTTGKQLVKTLYVMFRHLQQQSFKNLITLKTIARTQKDEPLYKNVCQRIDQIREKTDNYMKTLNNYHRTQLIYIKKSQQFQNVDAKPAEYYSVAAFTEKINKIKQMEVQLQRILDRLKLEHVAIQSLFVELRNIVKELLSNKIKRVYQIVSICREVIVRMMMFEEMIIEERSRDMITNLSQESFEDRQVTTAEDILNVAKSMIEKGRNGREILEQYLVNILKSIEEFKRQINNSEMSAVLVALNREKKGLESVIGGNLYYQKVDSEEELKLFTLFLNKLIDRFQINKLIGRYRKMEDDLLEKLQTEIRNMPKDLDKPLPSQSKLKDIKTSLKKKYSTQIQDLNNKLKDDIILLIKLLRQLREGFSKEFKPYIKLQQSKVQEQISNILKSEQYKLLSHPFLIQQNSFGFKRSPSISEFINIMNRESNIDNVTLDLSENGAPPKSKFISKALCCHHSQSKRDVNIIDQFNCALLDKILLQGKLILYKKQIMFKSAFNKTTFFGKTKILIPIRDIQNIDKDDRFLNGIFIQTTHGILKFTSFLTNPVPILKHYYVNTKQSTLPGPHPMQSHMNPARHYQSQSEVNRYSYSQEPNPLTSKLKVKLMNLGYKQSDNNTMYKELKSGDAVTLQSIRFKEEKNIVVMSVSYTKDNNTELYECQIKNNGSGNVQTQYNMSPTTTEFKNEFMSLTRSVIDNDLVKQSNPSHLLDVSEIGERTMIRSRSAILKCQIPSQPKYKSILKSPNTQDSIMIDISDDRLMNSRVSAHSPTKPRQQKSKIRGANKSRQEAKQYNPMVMYIIIGLILFILAVII